MSRIDGSSNPAIKPSTTADTAASPARSLVNARSLRNTLALAATMMTFGKSGTAAAVEFMPLGSYRVDPIAGKGTVADHGALEKLGAKAATGSAAAGMACLGFFAMSRRRREAVGASRTGGPGASSPACHASETPEPARPTVSTRDSAPRAPASAGDQAASPVGPDRIRLALTAQKLNLGFRALNFRPYLDSPQAFAGEVGRKCQLVRDSLPIAQTPAAGVRAILLSPSGANVVEAQIFEGRTVVAVLGPGANSMADQLQPLLGQAEPGDLKLCAVDTLAPSPHADPHGPHQPGPEAHQGVNEALSLMIGLHYQPDRLASLASQNDVAALLKWREDILRIGV